MSNNSHAEILIVDDDSTSRKILAHLLVAAGYKCRECEDGTKALQTIQERQPALLLLDFDMPGLNGAEVLKRLRSMRRQLERQNDELEQWRSNLERDLAAARLTQQSLIPQKPPALPGWEVATCYRPVIQVGGDIYGWLRMKDGQILFWIADGTGHGAAAALLTTLAKLLFHHGSVEHDAPASVMEAVNHDFRSIFGARSFMTAMCVAVDPATGRASVVGAGHPPLLIARRSGATEAIASVVPPLGLIEHPEF